MCWPPLPEWWTARPSLVAMCASCVAQGSLYVGGALVSLRVMAARASSRRAASTEDAPIDDELLEGSDVKGLRAN